jgi:hypothetical protein
MPSSTLPETTLRACGVVPPIVLDGAPSTTIPPSPALPSAAEPAASRPTRLPATRLPEVVAPEISTPSPVLPEITLPAPAIVPPIVLSVDPVLINTPILLGEAVDPLASVPIRLPWTTVVVLPSIQTPVWLPEMMFPSPALVPPTWAAGALCTSTP